MGLPKLLRYNVQNTVLNKSIIFLEDIILPLKMSWYEVVITSLPFQMFSVAAGTTAGGKLKSKKVKQSLVVRP
jgi:hypothetical protein